MRYVKWTLIFLVALSAFAFLNYNLPQKDIVRIADTYEKRVDPGENTWFWGSVDSGNAAGVNRDVFFIQAIQTNGRPMVYRNEDTGWGWPPYFKFDTSNLQAEAADLKSTKEAPQWVAVRHYGWRNEFLSIYPNAVAVWPVAGPDVTMIPWFNIIVLVLLALILLRLYRMVQRFRERRIDPMLDDMNQAWDRVEDHADAAGKRASGFWGRLIGRRK
ncbi:MAG: DUF1523 family protein [Rhodobacteraceae bacterium]|nr:DUF1523 family protein [Paracoccaceae bacterium]